MFQEKWMGEDRVGEVAGRASKEQIIGVNGTGFTARSLTEEGARDSTWEQGIEVGSDEELTKIRRAAELEERQGGD